MSSSGIQSVSSGPLIIRTYNASSSSDVTYVLQDYDYPVSSNYVLITSTNGQLVPSNNINVSSITTSSFNSDFGRFSTMYQSSVFGFSPINFYSPIRVNNQTPTEGVQLFVNGSTVLSEPGAQTTATNAGLTIWGLPNGNTIDTAFSTINTTTTTSATYTIDEPISKINFQLIGAGGANTYSNTNNTSQEPPGIGTYISGTLKVKQGDKLQFTLGAIGSVSNGSQGTSLVYLSSTNSPTNTIFVSTLVCVAGAGGGNGWSPDFISSSGGGHGGGGSGGVTVSGNVDYYAFGTIGISGISTVNGNYQSIVEGGQGGQANGGAGGIVDAPATGVPGSAGLPSNTTTLLTTGGLVLGGAGGNGGETGGYGGGGYTGGGGGAGSVYTSAGGGGGSTYIAFSTLSAYLSNLVCLGGQWIYQNNATPFGEDFGLPNNPGFASITGYEPNDTLYTNGDIECRVLRYTMLDPPINAVGGASALWALYPAIDIVHMNDNPILECGGIEVESGGIDITGNSIFRNQVSTLGSSYISSGLVVNGGGAGGGGVPYGAIKIEGGIDENSILIQDGTSVTPAGQYNGYFIGNSINFGGASTFQIGRIDNGTAVTTKAIYLTEPGNVGIGVTNPSTSLQVVVPPGGDGITGISAKSADVNTTIGAYSEGWFLNDNVGSIQTTREHNSTFYTLAVNPRGGDIYLGSSISNLIVFSESVGIGTTTPQTTLDVAGDIFATTGFITQDTRYLDNAQIIYGYDINSTISQYYYDGLFDTLQLAPPGQSRSQIKFNTATSGGTIATTQMILSHDGRLGVGTTTPSYTLDVNGVGQIPSLIVSSITTNAPSLNISTIGNLNITGNLNVGGAINHPDVAPVGSILMYAASSAPNGWLLCDGTIYPNASYPELYNIIGYNFGGNLTTTFAVPNMQQRFPVGVGAGYSMGQTGGFVSTTLTTNELPSHSHTITDPGHTHQIKCNCDTGGEYVLDDETNGAPGYYTSQSATTGITINNTGSGLPFDNRPPYFAINYIIKY
jgi:microcystin-dependent protein